MSEFMGLILGKYEAKVSDSELQIACYRLKIKFINFGSIKN